MQTLAQTFVALCTLVVWPSVVAFLVPPQSHHHHPYRPTTTTTTLVATQRSVRRQSYLHYRQQQHPNHDDSNHHDDNQEPASSSSSSFGSNSIQQLDIDDRLLSEFFDTVPSLQHWLYHGLSKVQSSDIS